MGNWPSVNSETSVSEAESDIDEEEEDDYDTDQEERMRSRESEMSFFSEEEVLPCDESDGGVIALDQMSDYESKVVPYLEQLCDMDHGSEESSLYFDPSLESDLHCKVEQEEDDDDDEEEEVEDDDDSDDSSSSAPLPPPPSPLYSAMTDDQDSGIMNEEVNTVEHQREEAAIPGQRVVAWEIDVSDIATKKPSKRKQSALSKLKAKKSDSGKGIKETEEKYIPPSVSTTPELLAQRKCLDQKRWFCMSRPQYSKSCGLSSVVSCWNYLFSTLGGGNIAPITQEEALTVLGFQPPFSEIRFGPFTGNATLMRWFKQLNDHYKVRGRAYYQYKPHGRGKTLGRTPAEGLHLLKQGLQDPNMAFIYHCNNHYFCPIGFEDVPLKAVDAYRSPLKQEEVETWILIGDPSRKQPGIHCFKWEDISTDLNCQSPEYLNIRKLQLGVQRRKTKKTGGNLHCVMAFCRSAGFLTKRSRGSQEKEVQQLSATQIEQPAASQNKGNGTGSVHSTGSGRSSAPKGTKVASKRSLKVRSDGGVDKTSVLDSHLRDNYETPCCSNISEKGTLCKSKSCSNASEMEGCNAEGCAEKSLSDTQLLASSARQNGQKVATKSGTSSQKGMGTRKQKKQKSNHGVDSARCPGNEETGDRLPWANASAVSSQEQEDYTGPLHTEETDSKLAAVAGGMSAESQESIKEREDLDKVTRFIQEVSTKFGLSLNSPGAKGAGPLQDFMERSRVTEGSSQITGRSAEGMGTSEAKSAAGNVSQSNWVLLGESSGLGQCLSQGSSGKCPGDRSSGNVPMDLAALRGMNEGTLEEVTADDDDDGKVDGREDEVSDLAKHLLDQYLVSIVQSISVQNEDGASKTHQD